MKNKDKTKNELLAELAEKKLLVEKLQKSHEKLERRVIERTEELSRINEDLEIENLSRKHAEKLAYGEKNKLKAVIDAIEYGLTIQDREYNIIYQNDILKNIFGRYGEKCYKVYEGKDKICEGCPVELSYKDGKSHSSQRKVTMPSGEIGYWENTASPIRNSEGEIVSCLEIARNITQQKKMEQELKDNEERFRAVATSTTDLIWEGDVINNSLNWFGDIDSYLGYEYEEFPRTISGHMDNIHPDDRDRFIKEVGDAVEKGHDFNSVYRIRCKDGTFRYWDERGKATGFQDGKAVKWLGSVTDITDRMKAEDNLIASEAKFKRLSQEFHALLNAIPDSLILLSPDLKILWSNSAFDTKIGREDVDFKGQHCYKLCCDIDSPCNNCPVSRSVKSGKEESTQVVDMDGKILDKRAFPISDMSGKVINVIEVARDITAKVRMEEESKLIQSRLIQANKMTSLGTLVSGVAHEVNNPNSYILTNAQIINEIWKDSAEILKEHCRDNQELKIGGIPFSELLDVTPKLISGINDGAIRIKKIVEGLKDFSRVDSADLGGKVNLKAVIMSARLLLETHILKHTNKFSINCDDSIPPVKGSTQQLEQVIINLLMNALQSLPDEESGVWISTSYNKKSKIVSVKVKDEGRGMSDEILDRVTEPFFTTKLNVGGTGLGLSISYTIIKDHKGSLLFNSKEGKGTVVTVNLPVYS
jgi:PAS domain S-box-containing protein